MKEMIKKYVAGVVCTLATLLITGSAWADTPTPIAVWSGDGLSSTEAQNGLTLNLNGNNVSDGVLTIGNSGVYITYTGTNPFGTNSNTQFFQAIVKYSDLTAPTEDNKAVVMVSLTNNDNDYLGNCVIKDGKVRGIWGGNSGASAIYAQGGSGKGPGSDTIVANRSVPSLFSTSYTRKTDAKSGYNTTIEGVHGFVDGGHAYGNTGLKGSYTVQKIYIGGRSGSNTVFEPATGMKIYGIALFTSPLTSGEIANYKFPSDVKLGADISFTNDDYSGNFPGVGGYVVDQILIPASDNLPDGTVLSLKKLTLAVETTGSGKSNTITVNGVTSGTVVMDGTWVNSSIPKIIYNFENGVDITVGTAAPITGFSSSRLKLFGTDTKNDPGRCYIGVTHVTTMTNGYRPAYIIDAVVKSTPTITKATVTVSGDARWGQINWDNEVKPSATLPAEITVAGGATIYMDGEVIAKNITFKGTGTVLITDDMLTPPTYNVGQITSELIIALSTASSLNVDSGANNLSYAYSGNNPITPTLTCTGVFTKDGAGTMKLNGDFAPSQVTVAAGILVHPDRTDWAFFTNNADNNQKFVVVKNEAQFDLANSKNRAIRFKIEGDGPQGATSASALYKSGDGGSVGEIGVGKEIILTGDASIDVAASKQWRLINAGIGPDSIELGTYTLTKKGAGTLTLANTSINGTGALKIAEGTVNLQTGSFAVNNGTIILAGGTVGDNATAKNVKLISGTVANDKALTVNGGELDLSERTSAIAGNLTIVSGTDVRFPEGTEQDTPLELCGGTLTAPATDETATVYVGDVLQKNAILTYSADNKTVSYRVPSTLDVTIPGNAVTLRDIIDAVEEKSEGWKGDVKVTLDSGATLTVDDTTIDYPKIFLVSAGSVAITSSDADNFAKLNVNDVAGDITITTATALDFNAGSHNVIYNYTGSDEISPTITAGSFELVNGALCGDAISVSNKLTLDEGTKMRLLVSSNGMVPGVAAIAGAGELIFDGNATTSAMPGDISSKLGSDWTGIVTLANFGANNGRQTYTQYYGPRLKFNGIDGYINGFGGSTFNTELILEDYVKTDGSVQVAWNQNNGGSGSIVVFDKLSGSGTLQGTTSAAQWFRFVDGSEFTGSFNIGHRNNDKDTTIVFGDTQVSDLAYKGRIIIQANKSVVVAEGKSWQTVYQIDVNGTIGGAGILGNDTTFGDGATLDCTKGTLSLAADKTATFGSTLNITGITAPVEDGAVKVLNGTFESTKLISCRVTIGGSDTYILEQRTDGIYVSVATEGDTYTFSAEEQAAISQIGLGGLYSTAVKQFGITKLENVPAGYFAWAEGVNIYAAKKSNSISIKLGTRTVDRDSRILTTDTNVGGFPVAGKFWNVAKVSNGNAGNPVSDYTTLWDGNKVDSGARIAYYAVNTYFAANSPTPFNTGNERLLGTYLDDGDVAKDTLWTITESSDDTTIPDGGVTLPATPNNRGWEVQISNIPYDMYDLYVYVASDQPEDGLKACPVTISVDNGTTWSYYAGEAKGTDADSWSPLAYSHDGVVTEGRNYIRFRVSKNSTGVEDVSTIQLSHGTRNTGSKKRLGLAAIQIVEIDDDGVRDRKVVEDVETQNWHDAGAWVQTKKDGTTVDHDWVDSTSSNPITARIDASEISAITMDDDAVVDKLVISGEAETFTIEGDGELTATAIDATDFTGNIVFDAPVTGALSLGENAKLVVEIDAGEEVSVDNLLPTGLTIASGNITIIGSGTLVCDGKVPDAYATSLQNSTWTGTVWIKNILVPDVKNLTQFGQYKNTGSKVCLTGVRGWLNNGSQGVDFELKDETVEEVKVLGLEIQDSSGGYKYVFPKFTGTGSFKAATISTESAAYIVTDVSEFNGALLSTAGTLRKEGHAKDGAATNPRPIFVGYSDVNEVTAGTDSLIDIKSGTTVNAGCGWEAASVVFGDTLTVKGEIGDVLVSGVTTAPTAIPALTDVTGQSSMTLKYENNAIVLAQAAASFNGKGYATLADAITAANAGEAGGTVTVYAAWPEADALTIDVAEGKTITLVGGGDGSYVCGTVVTKTGAGTLVLDGPINSNVFAPIVSGGKMTVTDRVMDRVMKDSSGLSVFYCNSVKVAPNATFELNNNGDITMYAVFNGTEDGCGTFVKSGNGDVTLMTDVFGVFNGVVELDNGGLCGFGVNITIKNLLKISGAAYLDVTSDSSSYVIFDNGSKLDLSNISEERTDAIVKGNLTMAEGAAIVFAEDQEALLCNGALTIGEEAITGDTTVQDMSIFVDGQEYIADLGIAVAEGESGAKLYTVSYSNATPIIRITTDGMDASDLNAALDEAVEGTKVCFDDGATLTLDEDVENVDLVILGTANINGEGTISAATIAAAGKTIDLGEDVTFVPATPSELSTTTITGEGTIVYDGVLPGSESSSYQAADWTGTVWLKNYNYQRFDFGALGHGGSKVKLTHIWGFSPNDATSGANPEIVLVDEGSNVALEINDGHGDSKYFFRKLSGDGTFKTSGNQETNSQYRFYDVIDFEGTFALNGNNKRVVIGTGSTDAGNGQILIDNTATVAIPAGKTWSANKGIKVDGTIAGAGILGSDTTFGNGATIDASAAQLTVEANKTLTFGNTLIVKLASAPEEDSPVKIMNGSFTEQTFDTALTVVVNDQPAEGDFAIKQDADGVWAIANTEVVWTGKGTDRNWSNPDNWQGGIIPTAGRNVVIDVGGATDYSIVIDSDTAAINSLTVTGAGIVFSGAGTINGPITFTTPKIAGSLKSVGNVTVSASGAVEVAGGMDITGNLMFDGFFDLTFAEGTDISVSGDMTTTATDKHNINVYFNAGSIEVAETLHTLGRNATYISYHYGDGASENTTMIVRAKTIDASAFGAVYNAYEFRSGATVYVGEGGFNIAGRTADGETNMASATFNGGKYVATATSTFTVQKNYQVFADSTIEVVDGATLTINNSGKDFGQAGKKITKTGAGTLKFAGTVLTAIDVTAGAVEMTAGDEAGVTVSEGAKLYLKVTAEQKEAGYTSTATIPAGMNIYFILPDGTVVQGVGKILPPKTIVWVGDDQGSWDEPSNWSPAVVPLVDSNVGFSGEGEGTITIKISDGTRTVDGVIFNSSKNITIDGVVNVTGAITKDGTGTLAINLGADNSNAIAVTAGALEVNVPANTTRILSGAITGSGTIVKSGEGALHISRANNTGFTGRWDVQDGDLKGLAEKWYGADNNNTPIVLTVNDGATLHLANMGDSAYSLVCNGGTVNNDGTVTGNRYTMGCRQAKNITINGDTTFTGNQFGLLASNYGATTLTFNDNATLIINMNANSAFFMTSTTVSGAGTINVAQGIFSSANNNGAAPVVNEGVKVVVDGGTVKADKNTLTIHTLEYVSGSFASNANAAVKVTGSLSGSPTIPRLTLGDGATIPVTSEITVSSALALDDTINIDLGTTGSGNFHVITAPNGYEWDTTKVTLVGSDLTDWNVSAEGTTLVVSKLPLDAIVYEDDGYNFDEKVIKVDVTKIDSTLKGAQIKVVTTDKNGDDVSTTLVQIDGSKGMYDVVIGELTAGETYNFNVTFVDSKGDQIDQSKEADLKNIAVGTLIEGEDIFSADATSGESEVDGGEWDTEPTITDGKYVIDDETASVFNVTAEDPEGNFTVEYDLSFEPGFATELTAEESAPIAGLTIGAGDTDETTNWYRADSTNLETGSGWSKLDQSVTPGHYIIRMAFTATTVTYSVKGDEDTDFVTLTQNETTSAFEISPSAILSVSFQGSSALAKFGAKTDDTIDTAIANDGEKDLTTIDDVLASLLAGKTVTLKTNVAIDTNSLTVGELYNITADGFNLRWDDERIVSYDDKTGTFTITSEDPPANGFTSFENYALNLNSGDPSSKPIGVAPADNGKWNTLTVEIKGPDGDELEVRDGYAIKCIATPNVVGGKEVISTNLKQIDLPLPESGEVQYTIKIEVIKE